MSTPEFHPQTEPELARPGSLAQGELVGDAYRIERQIGSGGMGTVFSAVDERSGTRVAVKWVLPGADHARSRERLVREWHLARQVRHPNVVEILDAGQERGSSYLVMELLEGESLEAWVQKGPFEPDFAVRVLMPVMRGVAAAHAAGIVHRDLKPQNVVLRSEARGVRPTLIDFGISRAAAAGVYGDRKLTQHGFMVGTPLYMAPEQLIGAQEADRASDVYALGVILFEMLTGTTPFDAGAGESELITEKINRAPARLTEILPDVDPRLSAVVAKALERSPSKRFGTVAAFAQALEPFTGARFASDEPVYQGPTPVEVRGSTLRVRKRSAGARGIQRWLIAGALAAGLLVLGVVVGVLLAGDGDDAPLRAIELTGDEATQPGSTGAVDTPADLEPADAPLAPSPQPSPQPAPDPIANVEPGQASPPPEVSPTTRPEPAAAPPIRRRRRRPRPRRTSRRGPTTSRGHGRSGHLSVDDF